MLKVSSVQALGLRFEKLIMTLGSFKSRCITSYILIAWMPFII